MSEPVPLESLEAFAPSGGLIFWRSLGSFGMIEQVLSPEFSSPLHGHHGEDEAFYLLLGEASITRGDQTDTAKPGSYIVFRRDIPHWFRIDGTEPARLLQSKCRSSIYRVWSVDALPIVDTHFV